MENRVWHKWPDEIPKNSSRCYVTVRGRNGRHVVEGVFFEGGFIQGTHWGSSGAYLIWDKDVVGWMEREPMPEPMVVESATNTGVVKQGRWIDDADKTDARYGRHEYRCSICNERAYKFVGGIDNWWCNEEPPYCPYCGAKNKE